MKCLVLAGGKGDRLWPLSRQHYPKQFIKLQKNHSLFQETIARNIPFCDEFIIVTNEEYQFIIEDQMKSFQDITYRCVYEGVGRKTTAAIMLPIMQLAMSELVFVVGADQLVVGEDYKDAVMQAKELARMGYLVTIGMDFEKPQQRFGYIRYEGQDVLDFTEKPDEKTLGNFENTDYLVNTGMFLFQVGDILKQLVEYEPGVYQALYQTYQERKSRKGALYFSKEVMQKLPAMPIEKAVFEKTKIAKVVHGQFIWHDIGSLADLSQIDSYICNKGYVITNECKNVTVLNECSRRIVVADGLENAYIVNTKDAVYVAKDGDSENLKQIMSQHTELSPFFQDGRVSYRSWGTYELLVDEPGNRVKRILIRPGKTIYAHKHEFRRECWTVVRGTARITLDGKTADYQAGSCIVVAENVVHQITNIGEDALAVIEVSMGENVTENDIVSVQSRDLTETELGYEVEPFVKLFPAFKDYLWGGNKLKTMYQKKCDYDIVAESWELSAHEAGASIVTSGRHKGMPFPVYLDTIGKMYWGWKCQSLPNFPILVKFIDARDKLSVQVHPDDEYALENEGEYGKNEMWYVLDCEKDAGIYCGFNRDVTKEEVERRIRDNSILEVLNWIPAKKGDVFFIKAGTVHAIGAGMLVCEIQQSSNCTYRLYDFDRRDKFGNLRQLHLEKALDVLDYTKYQAVNACAASGENAEDAENNADENGTLLGRCKYFECYDYKIEKEQIITINPNSFLSLICVKGKGTVQMVQEKEDTLSFQMGDSIFVPAREGKLLVTGRCELVVTHV